MIRTEQEGDRLSHDELRNLVLNILVGGVDTSQLAHTVRLLAEHPDQWELLRSDPRFLAQAAVEEAPRFEPVTPFTARITVDELEWRESPSRPGRSRWYPPGTPTGTASPTGIRSRSPPSGRVLGYTHSAPGFITARAPIR